MKKLIMSVLVALALVTTSSAAEQSNALGAFNTITIPVMANTPGLQGAFFKTRVVIFNPTQDSYAVDATLYSTAGQVSKVAINMAAGQVRNYDNFLQQIFNF